jgi:hypothetical protein
VKIESNRPGCDTYRKGFYFISGILVAGFASFVCMNVYLFYLRFYLRRKGIYPKKGQESIEFVHSLAKLGYKNMAIRCHMEVTGADFEKSRDYVERISQS